MRVARRVAFGYVVLILLAAALLVVEFFAFRRLQAVNQRNSGENLNYALIAVELVRDGDAVEEHTRKYLALADQVSGEELKETQQRFEDALREIRNYRGSERTQIEMDRLDRFWREYLDGSAKSKPQKADAGGFSSELSDALSRVRTQSVTVYQVVLEDIRRSASESRKFSERTEFIAWWIGCATLTIGIFIALLVVRSIAGPLRSLSEGTRAIAEGKSYYRLDTSRSDEFSEIARDITTIIETRGERKEAEEAGSKRVEL